MTSPSAKYTHKLAGQRVLIFGGTSGIGFCVAEAALEHGADLVISSSNQTKLDKTVARLKETYPTETAKQTIITHVCDLSDVAHLDAHFEALFQAATSGGTKKLNHVVTTAGDALQLPPLSDVTAAQFYAAANVRCVAFAVMAKHLDKYLEKFPSSSFTLTSGLRGRKPAPGWSLMTSVCGAVEGLARGLAVDLKPIRVNVVSPGAVYTEMFEHFPKDQLEGVLQMFKEQSTTGTVARPEDLAESYIYLMKDQFVTGSIIESNGGALLV
ncbi:SDR family NAD(P)-dependent oxidoreductase [Aspergillus ibericus CBS 121593]|uniref:NAD(P)-binding protein n=1 Tax=Aspergillus ibericus CBS 121593 TaxID=1448316 RepID=A0A395GT62_9EURO|nr:NAD(P)-binding protein [Aspergillus ibericus CBS 121593]RAK98780.1 NAD(P)-binding protein [Aspergillus ibericus CBS 121593]